MQRITISPLCVPIQAMSQQGASHLKIRMVPICQILRHFVMIATAMPMFAVQNGEETSSESTGEQREIITD